jgi:hypothetical protein
VRPRGRCPAERPGRLPRSGTCARTCPGSCGCWRGPGAWATPTCREQPVGLSTLYRRHERGHLRCWAVARRDARRAAERLLAGVARAFSHSSSVPSRKRIAPRSSSYSKTARSTRQAPLKQTTTTAWSPCGAPRGTSPTRWPICATTSKASSSPNSKAGRADAPDARRHARRRHRDLGQYTAATAARAQRSDLRRSHDDLHASPARSSTAPLPARSATTTTADASTATHHRLSHTTTWRIASALDPANRRTAVARAASCVGAAPSAEARLAASLGACNRLKSDA